MSATGVSGYVPCYNNASTVRRAVESLLGQDVGLVEVMVVDDGSSDGSMGRVAGLPVRVVRQPGNLGRGAARARAMTEAQGEFVVCCDATNTLPPDFIRTAQRWFEDARVAAVFGGIADPEPRGATGRWRARHLFKQGRMRTVAHRATLSTYGAVVRRAAVEAAGGFSPALRHNEDNDLGERLLGAGYDVVFDPALQAWAQTQNNIGQVLERYWRWNMGSAGGAGWGQYFRAIGYATRTMLIDDLRARDPLAAAITLACPHYCRVRTLRARRQEGKAR